MLNQDPIETFDLNQLRPTLSASEFALLLAVSHFYKDVDSHVDGSIASPHELLALASKDSLPEQLRYALARFAQMEQHQYYLHNRAQYLDLLEVLAYTAPEAQRKTSFLNLLNWHHMDKAPKEDTVIPMIMVALCLQEEEQFEMASDFLRQALEIADCPQLTQFIEERLSECNASQRNSDAAKQAIAKLSSAYRLPADNGVW